MQEENFLKLVADNLKNERLISSTINKVCAYSSKYFFESAKNVVSTIEHVLARVPMNSKFNYSVILKQSGNKTKVDTIASKMSTLLSGYVFSGKYKEECKALYDVLKNICLTSGKASFCSIAQMESMMDMSEEDDEINVDRFAFFLAYDTKVILKYYTASESYSFDEFENKAELIGVDVNEIQDLKGTIEILNNPLYNARFLVVLLCGIYKERNNKSISRMITSYSTSVMNHLVGKCYVGTCVAPNFFDLSKEWKNVKNVQDAYAAYPEFSGSLLVSNIYEYLQSEQTIDSVTKEESMFLQRMIQFNLLGLSDESIITEQEMTAILFPVVLELYIQGKKQKEEKKVESNTPSSAPAVTVNMDRERELESEIEKLTAINKELSEYQKSEEDKKRKIQKLEARIKELESLSKKKDEEMDGLVDLLCQYMPYESAESIEPDSASDAPKTAKDYSSLLRQAAKDLRVIICGCTVPIINKMKIRQPDIRCFYGDELTKDADNAFANADLVILRTTSIGHDQEIKVKKNANKVEYVNRTNNIDVLEQTIYEALVKHNMVEECLEPEIVRV